MPPTKKPRSKPANKPTGPADLTVANQTNLPDDTVNTIVKKRGHGPLPGEDASLTTEPGDNSRYVRFAMASWNLPPIDISDPKQVEQRITDYFVHCAENDRKPQLVGMANWLGISRDTLNSWKRGEYRKETHSDVVQKAVSALEEMWADYMLNGKVNPASGIFVSKNWFGYRDIQDLVVTPNTPLDNLDPAAVSDRYLAGLPEAEDSK